MHWSLGPNDDGERALTADGLKCNSLALFHLITFLSYSPQAAAVAIAGSTIYYVHWSQEEDRKELRQGVYRDLERQARRAAADEAHSGQGSRTDGSDAR